MKRKGTVPDHGLWDDVRRTIMPLKGVKPTDADAALHQSHGAPKLVAGPPITLKRTLRDTTANHAPPPLAAFDRRTAQKLSRGKSEPDARMDLHGEGIETARVKLYHFLAAQRQQGARMVLVITGKGASPFARHTLHGLTHFQSPEREGRLRREVPHWLNEHMFRVHVIGFQPAHPRHGGGGAFYVRLRRAGDDP
jgi:DNA-nicking Smr family endonuclease